MGLFNFFFREPCHGNFDRVRYEGKSPNEIMEEEEHKRKMQQGELQEKFEEQKKEV